MPSPHPVPIEIARLKGADKKNPRRYRERQRAAKSAPGIGDPPAYLSAGAKAVWLDAAPHMVEGVLTIADRIAWSALCELEAERREDPRQFSGAKYSTLVSLLARFGMTPADRVRVSIAEEREPPANPFAEFATA